VLRVHPSHREEDKLPKGTMFRFHAGLEDPRDLIRDVEQASRVFIQREFSFPERARPLPKV
jgi:cystathionine beta-lyase/cystathionine gamma-synthase